MDPITRFKVNAGANGSYGSNQFAEGVASGGDRAAWNAESIANRVSSSLGSPSNSSYTWGYDTGFNFFDGLRSMADTIWTQARNIAQGVTNILGHSTPKEGPMVGDDQWFVHLGQNLEAGLRRTAPDVLNAAYDIAGGIAEGMDVDPVGELIANMRDNEMALASQSRRMAEIVTEQFAPNASASYSLGYDVKPMARMLANGVTEALRSGIPQRQGVTVVVQNMQVRSESDIRRVSEGLYTLAANAERRGW